MLDLLPVHWPEIALSLLAVAAGQIGRLGQKLERGESIGWRQFLIELSMFPAFGMIVGAAGVERHWPIWAILLAGISAGWLGFGTFQIIRGLAVALLQNMARGMLSLDFNGDNRPRSPPDGGGKSE